MPRGRKPNRERAEKQKRDWLKLPSDVTRNILYRVGVIDILENPQKAASSGCQLVDLTIVDFGLDDLLLYVADRASNVRRLEAAWCYEDIYNDWTDALKKFPLLEELSLYETSISEEAIEFVV
ncbi:hypothetical protein Tco_1183717 [Tanacetum coccineum]